MLVLGSHLSGEVPLELVEYHLHVSFRSDPTHMVASFLFYIHHTSVSSPVSGQILADTYGLECNLLIEGIDDFVSVPFVGLNFVDDRAYREYIPTIHIRCCGSRFM
jgi:hypothetical protein